MDSAANRYVRELIEAISAAVARDADVQAARARAKAAGFDIKVTLEALLNGTEPDESARARAAIVAPVRRPTPAAPQTYEITAADRRFLRSLRIAADETTEHVE